MQLVLSSMTYKSIQWLRCVMYANIRSALFFGLISLLCGAPARGEAQTTKPANVAKAVKAKAKVPRPSSRPSSRPVVKLSENEKLVLAFWKAVIERDYQSLFGTSGEPFVSDDKCKIFEKHEQVEKYLREQKLPANIKVGRPTTLRPGAKLPAYIQRLMSHLAPSQANCDDEKTNNLIIKAASLPVQFITVTLTVGSQRVFTVMRLSKLNGYWLVTGLKN